jgi:excisionase family DNA binding protein
VRTDTAVNDPSVLSERPWLVSRAETARLLGISIRHLEKMIRRGEVPSRVLGRRRLVPRDFLEQFVKGCEE